ncbi:hypothetical protein EHS39_11420 [Ensifer sp. MPMI2T]|nr:hypothetical protein EHS39_11420 [Ensifer sp. MPMI2T]
MEIIVGAVIAWLVLGAIGSILAMEFFWRRGQRPLDVDIGDLGFFCCMAVGGPINFFVGVLFLVGWLYRTTFKSCGIDPDTVVFKARRT